MVSEKYQEIKEKTTFFDNTLVSVFRNTEATRGVVRSLNPVIDRIRSGSGGLDDKTLFCNALANSEKDKYRSYKAKNLPCVTFSGTFPKGKRKAQYLQQHSGLVPIDIDGLNPADIPSLLAELAQMPQVVLAFVSPSGFGIKVIVRVDPIPSDASEHKGAYQACLEFFEDLATEYNFEIDTSGSDCSRLCLLAHDPLAIFNKKPIPIEWDRDEWKSQHQKAPDSENTGADFHGDVDIEVLEFIAPDDYQFWIETGFACHNSGVPFDVWDNWSKKSRKYKAGETAAKWATFGNDYAGRKITWGTVVHRAKENGYIPPPRTKAKLQHTREHETAPTETLEANRATRERAADSFLTETPHTETLHMLLVKDATGSGKSHTVIGKAQQHEKRTLAQLPHTELARQAVNIAFEHGYKNPLHLVGREHNWDASGIAAIPIENRTVDLFARNNCIMVDEVKRYTDNRLAPRIYCEHKCPFLERDDEGKIINICPHLSQYQDLGERDFVASCTPNLLFDLNFRGYLKSLVTATSEPTDEEMAMDAILGTESEATEVFDFAIVDDYGVAGLYSDVSFAEKEFKAVKKAWSGTPTADFAKRVIKAFKKKKPHAIVKALRKAFDDTAEFHTDIAENLTQHARIGSVQWAERAKSSQESRRLLTEKVIRYEDGGTQFIPVDFDAYKELMQKGIPSVHRQHIQTEDIGAEVRVPHTPTHALIAGVSLEDLTPIWQKGATPIELLDIFLSAIGNDKNAPINKRFRAGDEPEAVLTFSIPPQAPVGILDDIAMLSATTHPEDVKAAFDGQAVTFSEHTGGLLEPADGVQICQFTDARLTSASVFEYPTDADGKRKLQETPIGLTPTAEKRLAKLNNWAKSVEGVTAFISYKEFTEHFTESVDGFDIVTHFDKVAGLNFDGLKFLVVFGYPKVNHRDVMNHARVQFARDTEPLPKADPDLRDNAGKKISAYLQLTHEKNFTENGLSITERRYTDPRLEKIRHQLATEKLEQAFGRARFPIWTDTLTIGFTAAPVTGITEYSTLFSDAAFNLAETPSELLDAMQQIQHAEDTGDVKAVMDTQDLGKSQAYEITKKARQQEKADKDAELLSKADGLLSEGMSQRGAANALDIPLSNLQRLLNGK